MTGMLAGLGMISAGAGFVSPFGALLIGILAGTACFYSIHYVKQYLKIDDALDVFPVHGVSGILGTIVTAIFADELFGGSGNISENGILHQLLLQAFAAAVVIIWSAIISYLLFKIINVTIGLRVSEEDEIGGLDVALHD